MQRFQQGHTMWLLTKVNDIFVLGFANEAEEDSLLWSLQFLN